MPIPGSLYLALKQQTRVNLKDQNIDNNDLVKIAILIIENPNLQELDLSNNKITDLPTEIQNYFVSHPLLFEVKLDNNHAVVTEKVIDEESVQHVMTKNPDRKKYTKEVQVDKSLPRPMIMAFQELMSEKKKLLTLNEVLKKIFEELLESIEEIRSDTSGLIENVDEVLTAIEACETKCSKYPRKNEVIKKQFECIKDMMAGKQRIHAHFSSETLVAILKNPHVNKGPVKTLWFLHPPEAHCQKLPELCTRVETVAFNMVHKHTMIPLSFFTDLLSAIEKPEGQLTLKNLHFEDVSHLSSSSFAALTAIAQKIRVDIDSKDENLKFLLSPKNLSISTINDTWFCLVINILASPPYLQTQESILVSLDSGSEMQLLELLECIAHRPAVALRLENNSAKVINHSGFEPSAKKLTDLEITDSAFDSEKMLKKLIKCCKNAPQLRRLSLRRSTIDDQHDSLVYQLGETIATLTLEELDLREVSTKSAGIIIAILATKKTSLLRIFISPPDSTTESFDHHIALLVTHNPQLSILDLGTKDNLDVTFPKLKKVLFENTTLQSLGAISSQSVSFISVLQRNTDYLLLAKHAKIHKEVAECLDSLELELKNSSGILSSNLIAIFVEQLKRIAEIIKTAANMKFLYIRCQTLFPTIMNYILKYKFKLALTDYKVIYELLNLVKQNGYGNIADNYLPKVIQFEINDRVQLPNTGIEHIRLAIAIVDCAELPVSLNLSRCYSRTIDIINDNIKKIQDLSKRNLYLHENMPQWCAMIDTIRDDKRLEIHHKNDILYQFYLCLAPLGLLRNEHPKISKMREIAINYLIEKRSSDSLVLASTFIHSQISYPILAQIIGIPAHVTNLALSVITVDTIREKLNENKMNRNYLLPLAKQILNDYGALYLKEPLFITKLRGLVEKLLEVQQLNVELSGYSIRPAPLRLGSAK